MPKDALGQELSEGDYVAYPATVEGQLTMAFGAVKEFPHTSPHTASEVAIIRASKLVTVRYALDVIRIDPDRIDPETRRLIDRAVAFRLGRRP